MNDVLAHYASAFLGATVIEVAYWYELRHQLSHAKYVKCLRSPAYWITCALMVSLSPCAVLIWFSDQGHIDLKTYLLMGAAFPHFFKNAVSFFIKKETHLGSDVESPAKNNSAAIISYFLKR